MARIHVNHPRRPTNDVPGPLEPGTPPVEPDEGPAAPPLPGDPEPDHTIGPVVRWTAMILRAHRHAGLAP